MYCRQWSRSAGLSSGPVLSMMREPGFLGLDDDALDVVEPVLDRAVQLQRRLHRGLRVELRGEGYLEQHVLHHVAAVGLAERERPPLEQYVVVPPTLGRERRRIAHLALERHERQPHGPAGGIARGPALARSGVGRVAVGA